MRPCAATTKGALPPWTPDQGTELPGPSFTGASTCHSTGQRGRSAFSMGLRPEAPAEATNASCQPGEPRSCKPAFGNDDSHTNGTLKAAFRVRWSLRHSPGSDGLRNRSGTPLGRSFVRRALPLSYSPRQRPEAFGNPSVGCSWRADRYSICCFIIKNIRNSYPDSSAAAVPVTSRVHGIVSLARGVRGGRALSIHRDTGVPKRHLRPKPPEATAPRRTANV
jgi:hypothetical protein